jgi:hypothetical protein
VFHIVLFSQYFFRFLSIYCFSVFRYDFVWQIVWKLWRLSGGKQWGEIVKTVSLLSYRVKNFSLWRHHGIARKAVNECACVSTLNSPISWQTFTKLDTNFYAIGTTPTPYVSSNFLQLVIITWLTGEHERRERDPQHLVCGSGNFVW